MFSLISFFLSLFLGTQNNGIDRSDLRNKNKKQSDPAFLSSFVGQDDLLLKEAGFGMTGTFNLALKSILRC